MKWFIPVEIFQKKSNTFRGITFFPFLPKWPKFPVPFVWITSARLHVRRKWKIYDYFVNGTTQSRSCFQCQKKNQYHLTEIFHRNFHTNGEHSLFSLIQLFLLISHINEVVLMLTNTLIFKHNFHIKKTKEVCIKIRSTSASHSLKGQGTKPTTAGRIGVSWKQRPLKDPHQMTLNFNWLGLGNWVNPILGDSVCPVWWLKLNLIHSVS